MMLWVFMIGTVAGFVMGLMLVYRVAVKPLHDRIDRLLVEKQSLSAVYGRISEQFAPFMDRYPFSPEKFRFIGSPVDGIQFEDDKIVFVEFKTNKSGLSAVQRKIRRLVEDGRVVWFEFKMK